MNHGYALDQTQRDAWLREIQILQDVLKPYDGTVWFEYTIPRVGRRIDTLLIIKHVIFVIEFKIGSNEYSSSAIDQVWDYSLDLKNFHETSHDHVIAPILIATDAANTEINIITTLHNDMLLMPIKSTPNLLSDTIEQVLSLTEGQSIDSEEWAKGRYCPTPTIIEAAKALYSGHSVSDISRNDASAINLSRTSDAISNIISLSRDKSQKSICFITGVPGAGKTLVGLNTATANFDKTNALYSVFLSGNGPLVAILREALARDRINRESERGGKIKKGEAMSEVKAFIQNVHHFRDDCLINENQPPIEHVAIFDEAQRAWDVAQTSAFMRTKKVIVQGV